MSTTGQVGNSVQTVPLCPLLIHLVQGSGALFCDRQILTVFPILLCHCTIYPKIAKKVTRLQIVNDFVPFTYLYWFCLFIGR